MTIPGFTASNSLHSARGRYRTKAGPPGVFTLSAGVVPQLPRQLDLLLCLENCQFSSDEACRDTCFRLHDIRTTDDSFPPPGGGGGGGHNPHCTPKCEPCRRDANSETGRSRLCVTRDCEVNTVACSPVVPTTLS